MVTHGGRGGSDNNQNQRQIQAAEITKQVARILIINGTVLLFAKYLPVSMSHR